MRTNIVIDDELIRKAMQISGIKTKKEAVHTALLEFVNNRSRKDLRDLRGKIKFEAGYDYKNYRKDRNHDPS